MKKPAKRNPEAALGPVQLQAVARVFSILSEGSRLSILQALRGGPLCVGDLVKKTELKQANVSRQLGILSRAGLIVRAQDGNRAIYSIEMPMVFDLCEVVCDSMARNAARQAETLTKRR